METDQELEAFRTEYDQVWDKIIRCTIDNTGSKADEDNLKMLCDKRDELVDKYRAAYVARFAKKA